MITTPLMFLKLFQATRKDLAKLTTEREEIVRELKRLQDENDNLVGKTSATSAGDFLSWNPTPYINS